MQRTIFITGCSSGIGLVAAEALQKMGYRVLAGCRKAQDMERLQQSGFTAIQIDLDDPQSVQSAADTVLSLTDGKLYALFNNAGYGIYGPLQTISRHQLEQQFSTNLFGLHQLTLLLLPAMLKQGEGRIIQTSSVMGFVATPGRGAYAASKHALEGWSDALRLELRTSGLYLSLIEPGPITTQFTHNLTQTQQDNPVTNSPTMQRFTLPADAIVPKLLHALESPSPKARYRVTAIAHVLAVLKRVLPTRLLDKILANAK